MRLVFLSAMSFVVLGVFTASTARLAAAESSARVLRHIVMYKFKDDLTAEQLKEVLGAFSSLPEKIDTIIGFEAGTNVSTEGKSEGMTHVFVVTFADEKGRDTYLTHPAHLDYVKLARDKRDKVIVFDYWTGK
jgi:hypothetical protein